MTRCLPLRRRRDVCLAAVCVMSFGVSSAYGQAATSPTEKERQAVAALAAAGALVQINGEYQVVTVSFAGFFAPGEAPRTESPDDVLVHLKALPHLRTVNLANGRVTDAGLKHLHGLATLRSVTISGSGVTPEAIAALQAALPECRVLDRTRGGRSGDAPAAGDRGGPPSDTFSAFMASPLLRQMQSIEVQAELKLTREQFQAVEKVRSDSAAALRDVFSRTRAPGERDAFRGVPPPEELSRLRAADDEKLRAVLTPEQMQRLQQLAWRSTGLSPLAQADFAADLKLNEEQRSRVAALIQERTDATRSRFGGAPGSTAPVTPPAQWNETLLAVLTDEQRAAYEEKLGPPLQVTADHLARHVFAMLDTNGDGRLSDEEWQASRGTRTAFERSELKLTLPATPDEFVPVYTKTREASRGSRDSRPATFRGREADNRP